MKLSFQGATGCVTGSKYLLEMGGRRLLVDCGMFQERDLLGRNWEPFGFDPRDLDTVLLTHAHLDHCGLLPKLVKEGFRGKIVGTAATLEIAAIVLEDSAHIQLEDVKKKRWRHERQGRKPGHPVVPLYTPEDAKVCEQHFAPAQFDSPTDLGNGLSATFLHVGHILGASAIVVEAKGQAGPIRIMFSGDLGRKNRPLLKDPESPPEMVEYVQVESTYGDKVHEDPMLMEGQLADIINTTRKKGGNVVIPAFAVERSHELLFFLNKLILEKKIAPLPVFFDSPSAISVTEVYRNHPELFGENTSRYVREGHSPFEFPELRLTRSVDQSKAINAYRGGAVIIAGSGMCTGGRIKHHLQFNLPRKESTIVFVGYQAVGTLGRLITEGAKEVRVLGEMLPVVASIARLEGLSGHADRDDIVNWLSGIKDKPRETFVTHGEPKVSAAFAAYLRENMGWNARVPEYREEVTLS
jgi:metallo-beta-lactamase family protein